MVALTLSGCKNCISLPPLGQLPSLEELEIEGFDDVVAVSSEFYGSAFPHLAKLLIVSRYQRLYFCHMLKE